MLIRQPMWLLSFLLFITNTNALDVKLATQAPIIDGIDNEPQWQSAQWQPLDQVIIGGPLESSDFSAKYRLLWDTNTLYIQLNIIDDVLYDNHPNPLDGYWSDDCIEVFIDENASGGDHQYNHNAFAYHVSLDNQVVDLAKDRNPALYNQHINSQWTRNHQAPYEITWELAVKVFADSYQDNQQNTPVVLSAGKKMGFMLAYCDNDGSPIREHFIGSKDIQPLEGDKNRGWIDASVFDTLTLIK
ncbi:CBM9 family sugar-binding protein [Aliiglaciecola sp. LCG003]|uniref:CBM9 family sugar-binding protein n=1 Tax=Aliiglaciecola sp. LCG003 TaxID=3053655 RepID=UPI0025722BAF|nr:CBM9 family sugar-binding protein [Aliiglaciecola sp. LCG003]WJG08305.1 CBM9 family sugar-binding protein [Aliiglaciecola sp. LCG003]